MGNQTQSEAGFAQCPFIRPLSPELTSSLRHLRSASSSLQTRHVQTVLHPPKCAISHSHGRLNHIHLTHHSCSENYYSFVLISARFAHARYHWLLFRKKVHVKFRKCAQLYDEAVFALAEFCPLLEMVHFEGCHQLTDASVVTLAKHCRALSAVHFRKCRHLTDVSATALANHCHRLALVDLSECVELTDMAVVELATRCTELSVVGLCVAPSAP